MTISHQKLPNKKKDREKLREKGQFWTPSWVAEAMVSYVAKGSNLVFDPATGRGAFFKALKSIISSRGKVKFYGTDIDEEVLKDKTYETGDCILEIRDFIHNPPNKKFRSIVANPPYIRHHRLTKETKLKFKEISNRIIGSTIDGRAGLHIFFLIQALNLLDKKGRLAFIMPSDTCEGLFAPRLWGWITNNYLLECVVTFTPEATPFPNVDTNAIVLLIRNADPAKKIWWIKATQAYSDDLKMFILSSFKKRSLLTLKITRRDLQEAISTGLTRPPSKKDYKYRLSDFASVMRGIATGANSFFFLTSRKAKKLEIPERFLKPAIGRTRDVKGHTLTKSDLRDLEMKKRPTLLFSPDGRKPDEFPDTVQAYLKHGEELKLNERALIKTRNPWYKMEQRKIPNFLFAYLGRRNTRFIKNDAGTVPLTGFLCIYPHSDRKEFLDALWKILNSPRTQKNLKLVAKTYGSGAIKVEPRKLESLPIPEPILTKAMKDYADDRKELKLFD